MSDTLLFNIANIFVLPFWAMILLPNWGVTKKVMGSFIPFVVLAGLYIYFFSGSINLESVQVLSNPQLTDLARLFAIEKATATAWAHFLLMDLFVGRWIYWQGQRSGVWTVHSLILCLFAGPIGVLSHILTTWIGQKFFSLTADEAISITSPQKL
jgi:Domain of unknown function (DUF4281)